MYFKRKQRGPGGKSPEDAEADSPEFASLKLDLDFDAGGDLEVHQGLDRLLGGGDDVDEALVGAALELLTAVLVLVDGAQDGDDLGLVVGRGMGPETLASVRLAASTMVSAALSMSW